MEALHVVAEIIRYLDCVSWQCALYCKSTDGEIKKYM